MLRPKPIQIGILLPIAQSSNFLVTKLPFDLQLCDNFDWFTGSGPLIWWLA
jgi:hypothetical protein